MKEGNYIFLSTTYMCTVKRQYHLPLLTLSYPSMILSQKTLTPALNNKKYMGKVFTSM